MAKPDQGRPQGGSFINVPYSAAGSSFDNFPGRFWGVINDDLMPYADSYTIKLHGPESVFYNFRRAAKRFYSGLRTSHPFRGFTLFVNDVDAWEKLLFTLQFDGYRG